LALLRERHERPCGCRTSNYFDELAPSHRLPRGSGQGIVAVQTTTRKASQPMSALGHVWTAPWQELSDVAAALVGCGHVSGLFVRRIWPLRLLLCADRVPIESTHFKVR